MIDVIFLLLLFFVIMTSFEASARVPIEVPQPEKSQAKRESSSRQVVVNCGFADPAHPESSAVIYRVSANPAESLSAIAARLAAARQENPQLSVVIRADRRLPFSQVRPVMQAVADAGISALNVAAEQGGE